MEEVKKDPVEATESNVVPENAEANKGGASQEAKEDSGVKEPCSPQEEEEVQLITPPGIISLQRDLQTLVTNIQTAADDKESMMRRELEEARRIRLERLETDARSSQESFEEITSGWAVAKQKVIPQELHAALNQQQQLCSALIADKRALINDLQQELKVRDDRFVKDLRKQAEELDLLMERMEDQIKSLTKAYREELAQVEGAHKQESDTWLTRDMAEWDQLLKDLWDSELEQSEQTKKIVEEYEETVEDVIFETEDKHHNQCSQKLENFQALQRGNQKMKADTVLTKSKNRIQHLKNEANRTVMAANKRRINKLQKEKETLVAKQKIQEEQLKKTRERLLEDYKRNVAEHERIQKKIKLFAPADVRKFKSMWLMLDAEVKQLVDRALLVDKTICKYYLGLSWERPPVPFMEVTGPIQPQKRADNQEGPRSPQTGQDIQHSQRTMDASVGPELGTDTESTETGPVKKGSAVQSERWGAEAEEEALPTETVKKVIELLCDESGFLLEDKLLKMAAPMEKEGQTVGKLISLLCAFGMDSSDEPELAHFLLRYSRQQREIGDVVTGSSDEADEVDVTSELLDPNHVLPALKDFLEQRLKSRGSSAGPDLSFQPREERDTSQDRAYWESMGNVIPEEKLKLWGQAEDTLKQYRAVLTDISELTHESQSLEQQNAEMRKLLMQPPF